MTDASAAPVLRAENLVKRYGALEAVAGVSLEIRRGEIVGLLGPNGAGKTTTISMLLGVLAPTSGGIHIEGIDLARRRSDALEHTNFAAVYAPLPGNVTVEQNLRFFGMIYGVPRLGERIGEVIAAFGLERLRRTRCGLLSSGEATRVALAKALLNRPKLLFLDEPTASLDPATAREIRRRIRAYADAGAGGVLWTSHNMQEVEQTCDRVLFLSHGRVLLEGDPRALPALHGAATLEDLFVHVASEPLGEGDA